MARRGLEECFDGLLALLIIEVDNFEHLSKLDDVLLLMGALEVGILLE